MTRSNRSSVSRWLATALLFSLVAGSAALAQGPDTDTVALGDGVLVDTARGVAYFMNPELLVEAVELSSGSRLWSSRVAAKPLLVAGNVLVAQAESRGAGSLEIMSFDVRDGLPGELRGRVDLPDGVTAGLHDTLKGTFRVRAQREGDAVVLSWTATKVGDEFTHGYLPSGREEQVPALDASRTSVAVADDKRFRRLEGAAQMSLSSGLVGPATKTAVQRRPLDVLSGKPAALKGRHFSSADGLHALASERVAGADVWHSYRWTIYDLASGRRLGAMSHHTSSAPFVVAGERLIYLSRRYFRSQGDQLLDEPRQLRVVDLASGAELMALKTGEPDFQGPFPP